MSLNTTEAGRPELTREIRAEDIQRSEAGLRRPARHAPR
jgi:hypothetical protein